MCLKGHIPWNKGLKGIIKPNSGSFVKGRTPWNKGTSGAYSKQYIEKLRISHTGKFGSRASNWQGGKWFEPYSPLFNRQLKDRVRVRDNFTCRICGVPEIECSRRLHVHHIDYDKKNCSLDNLVSLCIKCHLKTNGNREYWKQALSQKVEV